MTACWYFTILNITLSYELILERFKCPRDRNSKPTNLMKTPEPQNDSNCLKNSNTGLDRTKKKPHCRFSWQPTSILDITPSYELILGRFKCLRDRDSKHYKSHEDTRTQKQSEPPQNSQNRKFSVETEISKSKIPSFILEIITQITNTNQH